MRIRIGFDLVFGVAAPTPMMLMLYVHPSRERDLEQPERLQFEPYVPAPEFTDVFGNKAARIIAPAGELRIRHDAVIRDSGEPDAPGDAAEPVPVTQLPPDV